MSNINDVMAKNNGETTVLRAAANVTYTDTAVVVDTDEWNCKDIDPRVLTLSVDKHATDNPTIAVRMKVNGGRYVNSSNADVTLLSFTLGTGTGTVVSSVLLPDKLGGLIVFEITVTTATAHNLKIEGWGR